jgi:3-oxoacyl-[acyl-carrier-protein] synthase III
VGILSALEIARGWLRENGQRYAAIVSAERWADTIDREDVTVVTTWGFSDGAGALIVSSETDDPRAIAHYSGSVFATISELNDHVVVKYGGTRHPTAPPGLRMPHARRVNRFLAAEQVRELREQAYRNAFARARVMSPRDPEWIICAQVSPKFLGHLSELAGVRPDRIVRTGTDSGHLGGADIVLGLDRLLAQQGRSLRGPIMVVATSPYSIGVSMLELAPEGRS